LASAIDFYLEGWKERKYLDDDGKEMGLDHSGLYLRGCLVHGDILVDSHGHRSKNLRQICEEIAKEMEAEKRVCRGPETF